MLLKSNGTDRPIRRASAMVFFEQGAMGVGLHRISIDLDEPTETKSCELMPMISCQDSFYLLHNYFRV